ncbi:tetratricopeptide repeat protein [bacterium]|nr:tetratricopeptide repeat protein [bacterium]
MKIIERIQNFCHTELDSVSKKFCISYKFQSYFHNQTLKQVQGDILFKFIIAFLISSFSLNPVFALDMSGIKLVNPLDNNPETYQETINQPQYTLKRGSLTKNTVKNQYTIAMEKFMQSNVRSSYQDFKMLIENIVPSDYVYMKLTQEMASIGFFSLAELSMSKINDNEISSLIEEDVKNYYFPNYKLTYKDQMYLAEIFSNIMYNDQSREATSELLKNTSLLSDSDYANYLAAFGSMKNGDIKQAQKSIETAIDKNPKNINYKRLKAEIYSQSNKPQDGVKFLNDLNFANINTVIFDKELHSSQQYILYKAAKNDYWKKYYLAYYYYDENELNKSLRVLQTSISGKKNINKEVYALTAKVYFDMKEFEKAQDYALKAIDIEPNNTDALITLGDIAVRNKDYKNAELYFKKASSKDKSHIAEIKLAKVYQELNNTKKAKDIYSKILRISSKSYEAYYQMALLEKDRESTYLKKTVAINPDFKDGWLDLARLEINKDSYDKAVSYLNIAKYIDDNDYRYYYFMGLIMKNKGLNDEAKKNFEKSLSINPDYELAKEELKI